MPPRISELLGGPFTGLSIYPRASELPLRQVFGLLLLVLLICSALLSFKWYGVRRVQLAEARESQLWLMPRVTLQGSEVRVDSPPGRLFDGVHFLVWLDPTTDRPEGVPLQPGETRPVVHVGRSALVLHRFGRPPQPLAWSSLSARYGDLSLDGTQLADWLAGELPARTVERFAAGSLLAAGYQGLFLLVLAGLYRILFYRGLHVPLLGALLRAGSLSAIPPVVVGALLLLAGLGQGPMLTVHALLSGALFLAAATRLRFEERPAADGADPSD